MPDLSMLQITKLLLTLAGPALMVLIFAYPTLAWVNYVTANLVALRQGAAPSTDAPRRVAPCHVNSGLVPPPPPLIQP